MHYRRRVTIALLSLAFAITFFYNACGKISDVEYYQESTGDFRFDYQNRYLTPNESAKFNVYGGVPPYKLELIGPGSLDTGLQVYSAPNEFGEAQIVATDQNGKSIVHNVFFEPSGLPSKAFGANANAKGNTSLSDEIGVASTFIADRLGLDPGHPEYDWVPRTKELSILDFAFQSDGKIVALGATSNASELNEQDADGKLVANDMNFFLVRFFENGVLDEEFGYKGIVYTYLELRGNAIFHVPHNLKILPDDSILVAGTQGPRDLASHIYVKKYSKNGYPYHGFGRNKDKPGLSDPIIMASEYRVSANALPDKKVNAMAVQHDGKIVVVGGALMQLSPRESKEAYRMIAARYNEDGTIDRTFGNEGYRILTFPNIPTGPLCPGEASSTLARAVTILPDGRIAIGGGTPGIGFSYFASYNFCEAAHFIVAVLNPDGSSDTSFGQELNVVKLGSIVADVAQLVGIFSVNAGVSDILYDPITKRLVAAASVVDFSVCHTHRKIGEIRYDGTVMDRNGCDAPPEFAATSDTPYPNKGIFPAMFEISLDGSQIGQLPNGGTKDFSATNLATDQPEFLIELVQQGLYGLLPVFNLPIPFNALTQIAQSSDGTFYASGASLNLYGFALRIHRDDGELKIDSKFGQPDENNFIKGMPLGFNTYKTGSLNRFASAVAVHPNGQLLLGVSSRDLNDEPQFAILGLNR